MPQLEGSVGRNGRNLVHDVACIQAALRLARVKGAESLYSGPVDGRYTANRDAIEGALAWLQRSARLPVTGRIERVGGLMQRLRGTLRPEYRKMRGIRGTAALAIGRDGRVYGREGGLGELALPAAHKAELSGLRRTLSQKLDLAFFADGAETDASGRAHVALGFEGLYFLDHRLAPVPDPAAWPRPVAKAIERAASAAPRFGVRARSGRWGVMTRAPVHFKSAAGPAPARGKRPFLTGTVGRGGSNAPHDIAVVRAALGAITRPDGAGRFWTKGGSGAEGLAAAITAFQVASRLNPTGILGPGHETEAHLRARLDPGLIPHCTNKHRL